MDRIADFLRAFGRSTEFRRAYVGGTFDCLHRGHLALFAHTKKIAREVVVSVNTDEFAARYKRQPVLPLADRLAVLRACRLVDRVMVNYGNEYSAAPVAESGADCIVHGSDWFGDSLLRQMGLTQAWLDARGITMVTLPYTSFTSTTQLLAAYEARKMAAPRAVDLREQDGRYIVTLDDRVVYDGNDKGEAYRRWRDAHVDLYHHGARIF